MKKTAAFLGTLSLIFGLITPAAASLVGDDVLVQYIELNTVWQSDNITVTDDATDAIQTARDTVTLDMGPSGVQMDLAWPNSFAPDNRFSGIKISGINDTANPDWILLDVDVTTNMAGWTDNRLDFGYDETGSWVSFAWQGLGWEQNQSFDALFTLGPNPIPIPATVVLFVTGLIGFVIIRSKLKS
jgi:hypothetical protein